MGRYDFRPLRVHQTATRLLATERISSAPPWYDVIARIPPAQTLVRTQPLQHHEPVRKSKTKKPSKLFHPAQITFEEDRLRTEFFRDHPWELARPRIVLEDDGRDAERNDWSHIEQPGRPLNGESVVQRQLWLLQNVPNMTSAKAYDHARKEFYEIRLQEEVETRVAKEEALATGAYFGKSTLEIGMELEDKQYGNWKQWATEDILKDKQALAARYTGNASDVSPDDAEKEAGHEETPDSKPAQEQAPLGGALNTALNM